MGVTFVRIKALLVGAVLALGVMGVGSASAQTVTVCYEYHVVIADQVNEHSGPEGEPVCQTVEVPAP